MSIKYHAVTKVRGSLSGEIYPEYMEDRNTVIEAIDDARRDYFNSTSLDIVSVIQIDLNTGESRSVFNRKQLVDLFAAEEMAQHHEWLDLVMHGSYADQMRGWSAAL